MGPNSLDALCKRYGIDNAHRTKHGALLDAELLAEVYIEMNGGRQAALGLTQTGDRSSERNDAGEIVDVGKRPSPLPQRLGAAEREAHAKLVTELGEKALWKTYSA